MSLGLGRPVVWYDSFMFPCRPLRVQSLTSSQSVGERIHRHIGSVQRTSAALSSNFMHRK